MLHSNYFIILKLKLFTMTLFNIELKLQGHLINLPVYKHDTHKTLVKRLCNNNTIPKHYQSGIKEKIIKQLVSIIKSQSIKHTLKQKVSKFIIQQQQQSPLNRSKQVQQDRYVKSNQSSSNPQDKDNIRCLNTIVDNQSNLSPDLITAYETILTKSKDASMKKIAQRCLKSAKIIQQSNGNHIQSCKLNSQFNNEQIFSSQDPQFKIMKGQQSNHQNQNRIKYNYQRSSAPDSLILSQLYHHIDQATHFQNHLLTINQSTHYPQLRNNSRSNSNLAKLKRYKYIID